MIKKENTRICITIPKSLYNGIKKMSKKHNVTYSKIITNGMKWYIFGKVYED